MALRPFSRHSKSEADTETALDGDDGVPQFFSNGPRPVSNETRPAATPQEAADQNQIPAAQPVEAPQAADAGWYPDASDPELTRYWDGHHWTGQTMKVIPERRRTGGIASASMANSAQVDPPSAGAVVRTPDLLVPNRPVAPNQPEGLPSMETPPAAPDVTITPTVGTGSVSPAPVQAPSAPTSSFTSHADSAGGDESSERNGVQAGAAVAAQDSVPTIESTGIADRADDSDTAVSPPEANREGDTWFAEVARAVGRAQETKSPEAWQEAARVAIVVSEVAQTMQVMAEAELHAQKAAQTAQDATQIAALAEKAAAEANGTVVQTARTARIAADEARAAAQTAEQARLTAERAAEDVPKSAGLAKVAVQEAAKAVGNAKAIAEVVAKARLANTQEAWSEALRLVTTKSETARDHTGGADTTL
jgi:Protein of unknown function (DUF2510)